MRSILSGLNTPIPRHSTALAPARKEYGVLKHRRFRAIASSRPIPKGLHHSSPGLNRPVPVPGTVLPWGSVGIILNPERVASFGSCGPASLLRRHHISFDEWERERSRGLMQVLSELRAPAAWPPRVGPPWGQGTAVQPWAECANPFRIEYVNPSPPNLTGPCAQRIWRSQAPTFPRNRLLSANPEGIGSSKLRVEPSRPSSRDGSTLGERGNHPQP